MMEWIATALILWGVWGLMDKARKFLQHFQKLGGIPPIHGRWRITSPYGWRKHPYTGKRQFHSGVDLAVPCGTPVYAPYDGTVRYKWTDAGGHQLLITSADGKITMGFAHLQKVFKKSGWVRKGDLIALTGKSGNPPGPSKSYHCHLHITTYYSGRRVDAGKVSKKIGIA